MFLKFPHVRFVAAAPLALALILAAAGSALAVPVITETGTTAFYSPDNVMAAKEHGALPAQVHGSRSPGVAVAKLRLPASVGGGHLVPAGPGAGQEIRLVLVFNGKDVSPDQVCKAASDIRSGPPKRGLDVYAALCRGNEYFSHARLRDEAVSGVRDPRYANAMGQLLLALMPAEVPGEHGLD